MICPNCGAHLTNNAKFCPKCGNRVERPSAEQETAKIQVAEPINQNTVEQAAPQNYNNNFPAASNTYVKPVAKPNKKKLSVGGKIGVVLLAVCLFITSVAAMIVGEVRTTLSNKKSIEAVIEDVDVIELALESDIVSDRTLDDFYNDMYRKFGVDIDDESLDKFIDRSTIKQFFAKKVARFAGEVFTDDDAELVVTRKEVIELLEDNNNDIIKQFNKRLTMQDREDVAYWIMGNLEKEVLISMEDLQDEEQELYSVANISLSYITMAVFIALTALIIFFMMRISVSAGACGVGIVFTVIGALTAIVAPILGKLVLDGTLVGTVVGGFAMVNLVVNAIVLAVGIVLLITRAIVLKIRRS